MLELFLIKLTFVTVIAIVILNTITALPAIPVTATNNDSSTELTTVPELLTGITTAEIQMSASDVVLTHFIKKIKSLMINNVKQIRGLGKADVEKFEKFFEKFLGNYVKDLKSVLRGEDLSENYKCEDILSDRNALNIDFYEYFHQLYPEMQNECVNQIVCLVRYNLDTVLREIYFIIDNAKTAKLHGIVST